MGVSLVFLPHHARSRDYLLCGAYRLVGGLKVSRGSALLM